MLKNIVKYIREKRKNKNISEIKYQTLLPRDDVEDSSSEILDYAIKKENVNNIAITGGYSTGKSTLINSYFKGNKQVKRISLATFKEEKNINRKTIINKKTIVNNDINTIKKENHKSVILQEIEKTIVEKMYYDSYIKKMENKRYFNILITVFIFYMFFMLMHDIIVNYLLKLCIVNIWISIFVMEVLAFAIIYFIIKKISDLTSLKLKLGDIEVDAKIEKRNILNENLDILIKIMQKSRYKYVVFEDLDRFECPEVFEHLRDLNITINSALTNEIKFIYAVKDDMFTNENRTKFFDIIVPVVPYVSYENSGEELFKIIKYEYHLEKELPEQFIMSICAYISDIRILKNTINEYIIYKKKIGTQKLSEDTSFYKNLFAMMIYKNTCSKDFALLQKKEGEIYKFFSNIEEHRKAVIIKIENKEKEYLQKKKEIENSIIWNRDIFVDGLIAKIKRTITTRRYICRNREYFCN